MDELITSAQNPFVKQLRKLLSSNKTRQEDGIYVAEGAHLAASILLGKHLPLSYICAASALKNQEIDKMIEQLEAAGARRFVLADSLFESVSSIHASVGLLTTFSIVAPESAVLPTKTTSLLLDRVQDPGNLGTILRTAAASGVEHIFLSTECASPWAPKTLRAGMGAQFSLIIHENVDLATCMKEATVPIFATTLSNGSQSLYTLDLKRPAAWLFGNEGQGVSDDLLALASTKVSIPQVSSSVESLNVAASVAVCLYEQYRQSLL